MAEENQTPQVNADINEKKLLKSRPDSLTPEEKKHIAAFRWTMVFVAGSLILIGAIIWTIVSMLNA